METYISLLEINIINSRYQSQRRQWQPIPVFSPGKSIGWRSLVGCSLWGLYESGTAEQLHFHFSLSCIGEGNGNPLRSSCMENPMDRGALVGCSPWGCYESGTTERLHFHFSLSCIEEGNGNPLQCSCLENPRNRGAWWAAIYGVAKSQT